MGFKGLCLEGSAKSHGPNELGPGPRQVVLGLLGLYLKYPINTTSIGLSHHVMEEMDS